MEAALYLSEAPQASMVLQSIRSELTNAVRSALVRHAYDKDGRTLFVKPYWKGPSRKTKTTTTTRDREIVFQTMQKEKVDE